MLPDLARRAAAAVCYSFFRIAGPGMNKLRISVVQYLNTAPLVWGFTHGPLRGKYELSFTVPSQCAEELRSGAADVAIIPAIEYQRINGLAILPDLAIASKRRVRSLLLISQMPIERARSVALDSSSRSTQALTHILCSEKWKVSPEMQQAAPDLREMLARADAALLIGDPALRISIAIAAHTETAADGHQMCAGRAAGIAGVERLHVYDIVEEWNELTGLPAVLAIWAVRESAVTTELAEDFQRSRELGAANLSIISREASGELGLPPLELERYLRENIDFTLDAANLAGLKRYFAEAARLGLIAEAKPLQIAAARMAGARH